MIVDGHSDFLIDVLHRHKQGEGDAIRTRHVPQLRDGCVEVVFAAVAGDGGSQASSYEEAICSFETVRRAVNEASDDVMIVGSCGELSRAISEGRIALILGLEGASALEGDPERLDAFYERGARWLSITWNHRNAFADGLGVASARGLTSLGRRLVRRMERLRVLVDVSHGSERTVRDILSEAERPVFASHSNPWTVCPHQRNLRDELIDGIARTGGTIGVCFFPAMIASDHKPTLSDVVRHIRYLEQQVGADHVAIGADFIDYAEDLFKAGLAASGVDYGADLQYPVGLGSCRNLPTLWDGLIADGLLQRETASIMGGNLLRLLEECLP